ncbi:hypothetical protein Vretimale_18955 [Volvox reticuliferus]|uniref:RING-CH-type domain-containing protein n=3 Tax=Volvox reticuliferus TaxID=1737510 RepID=A0A8J4GY65_9CHLO|nr:hypothetical protein Vretimale_18955 [Volvox reticuliferus]
MAQINDVDTDDFCYICFEGATRGPSGELEPLVQVCRCPTRVHRRCVARWQLYSAGKREEKSCRFCQGTLPDWKEVLTPRALPPAVPILSIYYNNTCCRMKVRPGPDGLRAFLRQLEVIVGRDVANVNFVFRCRCPDTGAEIFLQGLQAFEAAMHCACVRAAQRSLQQQHQQQQLLLQQQQQEQQRQLSELSSLPQHEEYGHQHQRYHSQDQPRPLSERRRQQQLLMLQHCELVQRQHQRERTQLQPPRQSLLDAGQEPTSYDTATVDAMARTGDPQVIRRASAPSERNLRGATATAAVAATAITTTTRTGTGTTAVAAGYVPPHVENVTGLHSPALALFSFPSEPHPQLREAPAAAAAGAGAVLGVLGPGASTTAIASIERELSSRSGNPSSAVIDGAASRGCCGTDVSAAATGSACIDASRAYSAAAGRTSLQLPPASIPSAPSSYPAVRRGGPQPPALMPLLAPPQSPSSIFRMHRREASISAVLSARALAGGIFVGHIASLSHAVHISGAATAPVLSHLPDGSATNDGQPRTIPAGDGMIASVTSAPPSIPSPMAQAAFLITPTPATACDAAPRPASPLPLTAPPQLLPARPPATTSYLAGSSAGVTGTDGGAMADPPPRCLKVASGGQVASQGSTPLAAAALVPPATERDNGGMSVLGGSPSLPSPTQPTRPLSVNVEPHHPGAAESQTAGIGSCFMCSSGVAGRRATGGAGRASGGKLSAALLRLKELKVMMSQRFGRKAAGAAAAFT